LVDSAGWSVVDTYQLPEFEHGLAIEVVRLSDVSQADEIMRVFILIHMLKSTANFIKGYFRRRIK
jgi:hypothetical protein